MGAAALSAADRALLAGDRAAGARAFLGGAAEALGRRLRLALEVEGRSAVARHASFAAFFKRVARDLAAEFAALPVEGPEGFDSLESWALRRAGALVGEWTRRPLAEVVRLHQEAEGEERELFRRELQSRLVGPVEEVLADMLRARQIAYDESRLGFNDLYLGVLERLFAPATLEKRLATYDASKGAFEGWFLYGTGSVVRNEVRMWLRERSEAGQGIKKADEIREEEGRAARAVALDDEETHAEGHLHRAATEADRERADAAEERGRIRRAFAALTPEYRLALQALMLAYREMEPAEVTALARMRGADFNTVAEEAEALRDALRASPAFQEDEDADLKLGAFGERLANLRRRSQALRVKLHAVGLTEDRIPAFEGYALGLPLGEIERLRKGEAECAPEWKPYAERGGAVLWDFAECRIRHRTTEGRLAALQEAVRAGKHFVRPSHEQLSRFLGVPAGTVASRLNRAKAELAKLLGKG